MKKITIDELVESKKKAEKELSDMFNARIKKFEKETGAVVVQAEQYHRLYIYPEKPDENHEIFGFKLYIKYNGQYLELDNHDRN